MNALFSDDRRAWQSQLQKVEQANRALKQQHDASVKQWDEKQKAFKEKQKTSNQAVEARKKEYESMEPGAIEDYCDIVLSSSEYPEEFPQDYQMDYNQDNKLLVLDYSLPSLEALPTLKEVKYIKSKQEMKETHISESARNKLYDSLIYQITLRTIHELYEADVVHAIDLVVFNGWVNSTDPATGQDVNACLLSVQAGKDEFLTLNLDKVEPKVCFKALKGVGSSKLHSLTPIPPIMQISREDSRFVDAYSVTGDLDAGYNLAAMPWEDFEHLIRELFEKEFVQGGGEVKVTQASRDKGVDAIAFDPDPIRGGKIVIQAKRYTNTVGVSAVRDLYGTVMNEGATKGILVSTSDYGPDAYEFASGKPLTLLNGGNLLHLREKHGHKARIDIKEAKRLLADEGT